jgi:hypothetical protein
MSEARVRLIASDGGSPPSIVAGGSAEPAASGARRGRTAYLARHWRGDLPLAVSYWINGVAFSTAVVALQFGLGSLDVTAAPRLIGGAYAGLAIFRVIAGAWQAVGIWRSAGRTIRERRREGRRALWAFRARVVTVLGVLSIIVNGIQHTGPTAVAYLRLALAAESRPGSR